MNRGSVAGRATVRRTINGRWPSDEVAAEEEESTGQHRWILPYADFITLLMAFFVVMYSISSVNDGKVRVLSDTLVSTFKKSTDREPPHRPVPVDLGGATGAQPFPVIDSAGGKASAQLLETAALEGPNLGGDTDPAEQGTGVVSAATVKERMEGALAPFVKTDDVRIRESAEWIEVELNSRLLFGSGNPRLSQGARSIVNRMARIISGIDTVVRVEGFTDNVPISGGPYDSNWQLSAARAASVADDFAQHGVNPQRMSAVGFGEFHPVGDNATAAGRQRNRRVVVALAKHQAVDQAGPVGEASVRNTGAQDELPQRTLQRVTKLPGRIELN